MAAAFSCGLAPEVFGQAGPPGQSAAQSQGVAGSSAAPGATPGTVTTRQPVGPAPRRSHSFRRCYQEALNRRLRGAERRHFIASCRLGYGHRLFRGRGAAQPNPPAPGGSPGPADGSTPRTPEESGGSGASLPPSRSPVG